MIKSFFGKTRADGGFDMRFSSNKGGWLGKMGRSAVGEGIASVGVSGYLSAKKAADELAEDALTAFAPVLIEILNENTWHNDKKRPNKNLNEFIRNLPSTEIEKEARIIKYIDQTFEKSTNLHKRVSEDYYKRDKVNHPEILKKIDLSFSIIHDLMWVNKRFFGENAYSKDLTGMFKQTSPFKLFDSAKNNKRLKESVMKHYNSKSDKLFKDLFMQILEFYGNDESIGSEHKKKYIKYEKARFEITLLNNSYFSIPKIWFKRVLNKEENE
tara:strand:- start:312 stop:1121 length:810 start_codon:yes stop_codon:yes gene_type:complete